MVPPSNITEEQRGLAFIVNPHLQNGGVLMSQLSRSTAFLLWLRKEFKSIKVDNTYRYAHIGENHTYFNAYLYCL